MREKKTSLQINKNTKCSYHNLTKIVVKLYFYFLKSFISVPKYKTNMIFMTNKSKK